MFAVTAMIGRVCAAASGQVSCRGRGTVAEGCALAKRLVVVSPNTMEPPALGGPFQICTRMLLYVGVVVEPVW